MNKRYALLTLPVLLQWPAGVASAQAVGQVPQAYGGGAAGASVAEVIVTANRRTETLQKSPAAITAISPGEVARRGVAELSTLSNLVPSARFNSSAGSGAVQINLRGIGSSLDSPFVAEPVATNNDDVYVPRLATGRPIYDVHQIEVLPGPQATLYGKSAIGGVVNINHNIPGDSFGGSLVADLGNYGAHHLTGVVNLPVSSDLSMRVAGDLLDNDSYFTNGMGTRRSRAVRGSALYRPTNDLSILVWASYDQDRGIPQATSYILPFLNSDPYNQPRFDAVTGFDLATMHKRQWSAAVGGKIDASLGGVKLTYVPSYLKYKSDVFAAVQGFPINSILNIDQTTQELRASGDLGPKVSWLSGLYYYFNDTFQDATVGPPILPAIAGYRMTARSEGYGALLQLQYQVTGAVRLTAGGRYSDDTMTPVEASNHTPFGLVPFLDPSKKTWNNFDWKIGAQADVGRDSMVYGNVQTAYSPGGYRSSVLFSGEKLPKQTAIGYTIGSKSRLFDGILTLNVEGFLYNYDNYVGTTLVSGVVDNFNIPHSRILGGQIDGVLTPWRGMRLRLNVGLLDATIQSLNINGVDYKGNKLPYAPSATIGTGIEKDFDLSNGSYIGFDLDTIYNSGFWGVYTNAAGLRQKAYTKTDISLSYNDPDRKWSVTLYARNLENEATYTSQIETGYGGNFERASYLEAPRTFGVRLKYAFGGE